jgi:hypothetical protein
MKSGNAEIFVPDFSATKQPMKSCFDGGENQSSAKISVKLKA